MNNAQLEVYLKAHALRVKESMAAPFPDMKEDYMNFDTRKIKRSSRRLVCTALIAAVLALAGTAFAAGLGGGWFVCSDTRYDSVPEEAVLAQEVGYVPVVFESFENGYAYSSGTVEHNEVHKEATGDVKEFSSALFVYEKNGDEVYFSQYREEDVPLKAEGLLVEYEGVEIWYNIYTQKAVPEDYELSPEEEKERESGEVIFSFGSDEVRVFDVQSVAWAEKGCSFMLMQMDGELTAAQLTDMAKEIIDR